MINPLVSLLLLLAGPPGSLSSQGSSSENPTSAWIEITPLAYQDDATLLTVPAQPGPAPLPKAGEGLFLVCIGGEQVAVTCEQRFLEGKDTVDPAPRQGVRVTATLRTGGTPIEEARLSLAPKGLRTRRFITLPLSRDKKNGKLIREVSSDRKGSFTTPQLAPGEYVLQVQAPGGRLHHQEITVPRPEALLPKGPKTAAAEAILDLGEIAFDPGVSIAVFVTGPGGAPLPGVQVGAGQGDRPESTVFFETVTDAQGKALLTGLAPSGRTGVTCYSAGYAVLRQTFEAPPASVGCALEPLGSVKGSVVDLEGKPVRDVTISGTSLEPPVAASRDGSFTLQNLAAGSYAFTFAAPGFETGHLKLELAAGEARELPPVELRPGTEWKGLVRDERTREPISGAAIVSVEPPGAVATSSGAEGDFAFTAGDDEPFRLRVSAEDYARKVFDLSEAKRDDEGRLLLDLSRGGRIRVEVWDEESGSPCQGCPLSVQILGGGFESLATDGRGEALSGPLGEGRHLVTRVRVQSLGGIVRVQGGADNRSADVLPGQVTTVRFGEPTEEVRVHFRPPLPEGWSLAAETSSQQRKAERDPAGFFRVRRPAGSAVKLRLSSGGATVEQGTLPGDDTPPSVELALPQTTARGVLSLEKGPAGHRVLRFVSGADSTVRASVLAADDGSFSVSFLPPGTYTLLLEGQPLRSFYLADGSEEDLGRLETRP